MSEIDGDKPSPESREKRRRRRAVALPEGRSRQLRRQRARRLLLQVALLVGLPTAGAAVYFGWLASDQSESVSSFTIRGPDLESFAGLDGVMGALAGGGSSGARDALIAKDYILSRTMASLLVKEHGLVQHYAAPEHDWIARLPGAATSEEVYEYFLSHVEIEHDTQSNLLTMRVRAFSRDYAQSMAKVILESTERMVNRISERMRRDSLRYAEEELTVAQERLSKARRAVLDLQAEGAEFDPAQSATTVMQVRGGLEGDLAQARTELRSASAVMNPTAPQLVALKQRVASLEREIASQSRRLVAKEGTAGYGPSIARFEPALFEKELAERAFTSSVTALEIAHVQSARQQRYLLTIAEPSAPDAPTHPKRIASVFGALLVSVLVAGVVGLSLASIREHTKV